MARHRSLAAKVGAAAVTLLAAALAAACGQAQGNGAAPVSGRIAGRLPARLAAAPWRPTAIDFLSPREGYMVGERCRPGQADCQGAFGATGDGGRTFAWTALGPGEPNWLQMLDPSHGWVLVGAPGQVGRLLATSDGGRSWRAVGQGFDFVAPPHFLGPSVGVAVAGVAGASPPGDTRLVRTEDGGRTWQTVGTSVYAPTSVDFLSPSVGYVAGWRCAAQGPSAACEGAILGTSDGGGSWRVLQTVGMSNVANGGAFALDFVTPRTGFAVLPSLDGCTMGGCLPELEATSDGGATWRVLQPAYHWGPQISAGWPGGPQFADANVGWLTLSPGAGPGAGGVLVTLDGGRTFRQFFARTFVAGSLDPLGDMAYAIAVPNPALGGGAGTLVRITAQGRVRQIWPVAPIRGVVSGSGKTLYGVGLVYDPSALVRSGDRGGTWSFVADLPGTAPYLVSFASRERGYLVAASTWPHPGGLLFETGDGGRHWGRVGLVLHDDPRLVRFYRHGTGVAVLYRETGGAILRTADGGRTWVRYAGLPDGYTWALDFPTRDRGYAYVGGPGQAVLYETADGGRRWHVLLREKHVPARAWPGSAMAFDAGGLGIVQRYADSGKYLLTRDGGRTWRTLDLTAAGAPAAIAVQGGATALIQTTTGLLRTQDGGRSWLYVP